MIETLLNPSFLGPLCAFGSSVTWAVGSVGYSQLSKDHSPLAINFARASIALPCFILSVFLVSGGMSEAWVNFHAVRFSHWVWFLLSMTASYGIGDTCFLLSARSLGIPTALSIASCCPIWAVLAGYLYLGEKVTWLQGFGLFMILSGVVFVVLNGSKGNRERFNPGHQSILPLGGVHNAGLRAIPWKGLLLAIATSIAWATNSFAVSKAGTDLIPAVGNTVRMTIGLVVCGVLGKCYAPRSPITLKWQEISRFFWFFLFEAFGGGAFYIYGLSHSPLALGTTLASLAPIISVPVSWIFGMEKFSLTKTMAIAWVVVGVCFLVT